MKDLLRGSWRADGDDGRSTHIWPGHAMNAIAGRDDAVDGFSQLDASTMIYQMRRAGRIVVRRIDTVGTGTGAGMGVWPARCGD